MADKPKTSENPRIAEIGPVRRLVVKVGSAVIADKGRLRTKVIADLAYDVTVLMHQGYEVVMVVSGAVAAGFSGLDMAKPPIEVVERQAAACLGQYKLMTRFSSAFEKHRIKIAQLLMMSEDIEQRRRYLSARHTLSYLIERGVVPVINENDPLADDEQKIGDNDHLAALITSLVSADLLVILSVAPGVCENGGDKIIERVDVGSSVEKHIADSISASGVGGMAAKVSAAHLASRWGAATVIADGKKPGLLRKIVAGESIGTLFVPRNRSLNARKRWIAVRTKSRGTIQVDQGARNAIVSRGASLLPSGIVDVSGRFTMGARVDITDDAESPFAVGLVSYNADEIRRMMGHKRGEFETILGYKYVDEIVHRDDLVLLDGDNGE